MPWNVDSIPEPIETLANEYVNNAYEFSTSEASSSSYSIDASHDIDQNTNLNYKQTNQEANMVIPRQRKIILTKYTIYVTNQRMYIVGSNSRESIFRILEIDFTNMEKLIIMEDNVYFTRNEIMEVLNGIEESSEGGLTKKITAVGLLGFIKFTKYYYLLVVTKLKNVANLGGHPIYHIEDTHLIPVTNNHKITDKNTIESRYIQIFLNIDLNNTFYFSYSYDLTNTLQTNMMRNKKQSLGINGTNDLNKVFQFNERFMWNKALLDPIGFDKKYDWFQPIIHGFVDQVQISVFTFQFYIALIARRSHKFAGARFFKRGVNDCGDVANEVETEQIVSDSLTSSFHDTQAGFYNNPRFTSFVQHRGSIPLSWSQETAPNLRMTKPPIELSIIDPFYSKAALHFNNLFERYGCPVQVLNLIKQREKTPRETKLLDAFNDCITYLNQFLPGDKKIDYTEWDMSRASKSKSQDVIKWLENYSDETVKKTGFFHNGNSIVDTQLQQGVCRTNCVDCLDRTNSAQFVIGKRALGYQLHALGFIKEKYLEYDSDVTNILTEMFHDHGDTIALQYGGSHLVNTVQTYRKINQWSSHSRDIIESVKRFYSNSFIDAQRQEAINLFLGNYVYSPLKPMIWELNTDYYLHNTDNRSTVNGTISYTKWFNNSFLTDRKMLEQENWKTHQTNERLRKFQEKGLLTIKVEPYPGYFEHYWNIKYGNRNYTRLNDLFEFNMVSNRQYFTNNEQPKVVNQKIANKETKKLGIFSVFKHNDKSEDNPEQQEDTIKHARFNSFSDRIRGNSVTNKRNFDPENQQDDYFSPFKSRKPHRELKLIYSTNGDEDAIDEDNFEKNDSDYRYLEFANLLGYDLMDDDQLSLNEDLENKQHEFLFNLSQLRNLKKDQALKDNHFLSRAKLFEEAEYTLPIIKICDDAASEKADTAESQRSDEQDEECTIMDEIDESTSTSSYESLSDIFSRFSLSKPQIDESTIKLYKESVNLTYQIPLFREQSRNDKIIGLLEEYSQINGDIMDVKYVDKDGKKIMNIACDDNLSNFDNKFTNYSERRMNAPASNTEYFRFEKNYG